MEIDTFCAYPLNRLRINEQGKLSFCCHMDSCGSVLGDLNESIFDDIWFSDQAEEVRLAALKDKRLHRLCQCPTCPFVKVSPPYATVHVVYNEYPTSLELVIPDGDRENYLALLEKIPHMTHNLSELRFEGHAEPFKDNLLFTALSKLRFSSYANQIWVWLTTSGMTSDDITRYISTVPHSVTTFRIDPLVSGSINSLATFNLYRRPKQQFSQALVEVSEKNLDYVQSLVEPVAKSRSTFIFEFATQAVTPQNYGRFLRVQYDLLAECKRWGIACECPNKLTEVDVMLQ